jgi:SAM-dependent methyltransferase
MNMPLATEAEIQNAYQGAERAEKYVAERFVAPLFRMLHDKQVRAVQQEVDRRKPGSMLEIAPGPGRITRAIRPSGRLVCLEFNQGMIDEGKAACNGKAEWVQGNAFELPFEQEFDLVYTFRFIRHFHRPDRLRLYDQVRKVLRPGGTFIMDAVNERISKPLRDARPQEYPIYDKLYRIDELRFELSEAGLEPIDLQPVQKKNRLQSWSQIYIGPRANWLNRILIHALEALPARDGLEWIVTCRRA